MLVNKYNTTNKCGTGCLLNNFFLKLQLQSNCGLFANITHTERERERECNNIVFIFY